MIRGTENKKLWQSNEQQPYNGAHIIFTTDDGVNLGHYDASDNSECPYLDTYRGIWLSPRQIKEWCYLDNLIAQADKAERLQKAVDNSREKLAAFMHDVWGNWFAYQLNNSTIENLQRWGIQSNTPYSSLTETDKDKDRKFADKIIEIIKDEIKQLIKGE